MMVTIGREKIPWKEGMTIVQALEAIPDSHHYVVVKINGRMISRPNFDRTPVEDGMEIVPIPMIAGG